MASERRPEPAARYPEGPPAKMLLDSPATDPALRFAEVASALASIIETSEPRFAIGIFGGRCLRRRRRRSRPR